MNNKKLKKLKIINVIVKLFKLTNINEVKKAGTPPKAKLYLLKPISTFNSPLVWHLYS